MDRKIPRRKGVYKGGSFSSIIFEEESPYRTKIKLELRHYAINYPMCDPTAPVVNYDIA